jgi:hypothetical protein
MMKAKHKRLIGWMIIAGFPLIGLIFLVVNSIAVLGWATGIITVISAILMLAGVIALLIWAEKMTAARDVDDE